MRVEVSGAVQDLQRQFSDATLSVREDGQGGAYVVVEPVTLGPRFTPGKTWVGFQIPAQYPYADIYPVFVGAEIRHTDGTVFAAPVTTGHTFEGKPALQVSRRNSAAQDGLQKAPAKLLKVLDFLEKSG